MNFLRRRLRQNNTVAKAGVAKPFCIQQVRVGDVSTRHGMVNLLYTLERLGHSLSPWKAPLSNPSPTFTWNLPNYAILVLF